MAEDLAEFEDESKKIEKAINEINLSLEKGWLDGTHLDSKDGKKVFGRESREAKQIKKLIKDAAKGKA